MSNSDLERLVDLVGDGGVTVLTGAGLSTESGIPDYRGASAPGSGRPSAGPAEGLAPYRSTPMTLQTFRATAAARRRYWARSALGWPRIAAAQPNAGHHAVTRLQQRGLLEGIVTQNVDGLHTAAGAEDVVELHGRLADVICLDCGQRTSRQLLQQRLTAANRSWPAPIAPSNPDGDVELSLQQEVSFRLADCDRCGGTLKPDVVFFGEAVPPERVQRAFELVERSGCLLVLGSSLTVMSGYRFVLRAAKLGIPVAIVNDGPTRGDGQATVRLAGRLGAILPTLVDGVQPATSSTS